MKICPQIQPRVVDLNYYKKMPELKIICYFQNPIYKPLTAPFE
jgi:hypothetical protein